MILIIDICKERLHYFEFVKPICDILKENNIKYLTMHYKKIKEGDWRGISKVIICGTSLYDNEFLKDINLFRAILLSGKPILGICGGMHIIGLASGFDKQVAELNLKNNFKHILKKKIEVGFYKENFKKKFLGLEGEEEVYHLHNYYIDFEKLREFEIYCKNKKVTQAVKHKEKEIYGVLFHPEVRNKDLIINFCS